MKPPCRLAFALAAICLSTAASVPLWAQDATPQPSPPVSGRPPGDHGRPHHPPPPLMEALDTDHDGVLSANEIANSATSLKKLDKNGDGKLTEDELHPAPPAGGPGGPPPQRGDHPRPGDQGRNEDDSKGPDDFSGPAVAHQRPHHPPAPGGEDEASAPVGPEPRAMHRRGPAFDGPPAGPDNPAIAHAPASARAQRPAPPRLSDDPVAARLQASGPDSDRKPAGARVRSGELFDLMDTNHDGVISEEEKRAALNAVESLNRRGPDRDGDRPLPPPGRGE